MTNRDKEAKMLLAKDIIAKAMVVAMKKAAEETGALAIQVDAHLMLDAKSGVGGGDAAIAMVYPPEDRAPADPQAATKLVEETLQKLKKTRGS